MNGSTVCILMGVSGSGKSTIGKLLSQKLKWNFYDGDDFHSEANIRKMAEGVPLNDRDRLPWLQAIRTQIEEVIANRNNAIFACSALKQSYRELLQGNSDRLVWVYLQGTYQQIYQRMKDRKEHFMPPAMLQSQLENLEIPEDALTVDTSLSSEEIVEAIARYLSSISDFISS